MAGTAEESRLRIGSGHPFYGLTTDPAQRADEAGRRIRYWLYYPPLWPLFMATSLVAAVLV